MIQWSLVQKGHVNGLSWAQNGITELFMVDPAIVACDILGVRATFVCFAEHQRDLEDFFSSSTLYKS